MGGGRQRYRIVNRDRLYWGLECAGEGDFRSWYLRTLEPDCRGGHHVCDPLWTGSAAGGDRSWVERIADTMPRGGADTAGGVPRVGGRGSAGRLCVNHKQAPP